MILSIEDTYVHSYVRKSYAKKCKAYAKTVANRLTNPLWTFMEIWHYFWAIIGAQVPLIETFVNRTSHGPQPIFRHKKGPAAFGENGLAHRVYISILIESSIIYDFDTCFFFRRDFSISYKGRRRPIWIVTDANQFSTVCKKKNKLCHTAMTYLAIYDVLLPLERYPWPVYFFSTRSFHPQQNFRPFPDRLSLSLSLVVSFVCTGYLIEFVQIWRSHVHFFYLTKAYLKNYLHMSIALWMYRKYENIETDNLKYFIYIYYTFIQYIFNMLNIEFK